MDLRCACVGAAVSCWVVYRALKQAPQGHIDEAGILIGVVCLRGQTVLWWCWKVGVVM